MEVHAHSHTSRKKWTHYLWEFLMLFLAVFCGFLAELKLEQYIEHHRAEIYAKNLYEELSTDTARISRILEKTQKTVKELDSLCFYASEKSEKPVSTGLLYYYAQNIPDVEYFSSSNATIEELKGSGNLRLMKSEVSQQISQYDKKLRELENEYQLSRKEFDNIERLYFRIFDGYLTSRFSNKYRYNGRLDSIAALQLPLINDDPKLMKELIGWLSFESGIYEHQRENYLIPLHHSASALMTLLKKEYKLK